MDGGKEPALQVITRKDGGATDPGPETGSEKFWLHPAFRANCLFFALSLLLMMPALWLSNPFGTDGPVHIRWQIHYAHAFWGGQPLVRWLPEMNAGFGSPAFFFYPPLLQAVSALFCVVLPGDTEAIRRLALGLVVLTWLSARACHAWLLGLGASRNGALLAGLLWLLMPYRAFVDVYQRAALAECASLALLPLAALAALWVAEARRFGWSLHALAVGLLAYAHLPGMVIGYLFLAAQGIALVISQPLAERRWHVLRSLTSSALVGLLLSAVMLVPALGLLDQLVDTTAMSGERNRPHNWLLFSSRPWVDPVAKLMTTGILLMTLTLACGLFQWACRDATARGRAVAWSMIGVVVAVALLNTELLHPFWDMPTPLGRIQFPFRLLGLSSLAVCVLAGLAYGNDELWRARALWLLLFAVFVGDCSVFAYQRLRPREIFPLTVAQVLQSSYDSSEYVLGDPGPAFENPGGHGVSRGSAADLKILSEDLGNRRISVEYSAVRGSVIFLRQYAFTGWQCRIDAGPWYAAGNMAFPAIGAKTAAATARIPVCAVPQGRHRLDVRMPASKPEKLGLMLGALGLVVIVLSAIKCFCL